MLNSEDWEDYNSDLVWNFKKIGFFIYSDLTWFGNGEFTEENIKFFQKGGRQSTLGYGVSVATPINAG